MRGTLGSEALVVGASFEGLDHEENRIQVSGTGTDIDVIICGGSGRRDLRH